MYLLLGQHLEEEVAHYQMRVKLDEELSLRMPAVELKMFLKSAQFN